MKVTPVAATQLYIVPASIVDTPMGDEMCRTLEMSAGGWESDIDVLHEFAGRACYQSWSKPNPKTANTEGYLDHIIESEHESVLEHGSVTFYIEGVSRALTHELIRHRHLSFSELSQRYVDVSDLETIIPPDIARLPDGLAKQILIEDIEQVEQKAKSKYGKIAQTLTNLGFKRKRARQAARYVLPNVETRMVVTGNLRAWRYVVKKRIDPAADEEIRQFATEVLGWLKVIAPHSVQDMEVE